MLTLNKVANDLSCYKMVCEMSRYSGPEPQTLPLPPELVVRTLSYLDNARDKRNARLVCKGFAAAGLYSLTTAAYFSTRLIEQAHSSTAPVFSSPIREMAMHPVLSKYITKMVCDGTQLPCSYVQLKPFQNWWATLSKSQTPWPLKEAHRFYVSRYKLESLVICEDEDRKIFRTALERFVKLKCIVFTDVAADEHCQNLPRTSWPPLNLPEGFDP